MLVKNEIEIRLKMNSLIIEPKPRISQNGIDLRLDGEMATQNETKEMIIYKEEESLERFYTVSKDMKSLGFEPMTFYLLSTVETIELPHDLVGLCCLRSTIARLGFISAPTIVDVGFKGTLTIETLYAGKDLLILPVNLPFLHLVLFSTKHADELYDGFYKGQTGIRLPMPYERTKK